MTGSLPARLVAPAKLTLGLRVLGRRSDGFHVIDAEMVSLDLSDTVELDVGRGTTYVGPFAPREGMGDQDLVQRALDAAHRVASAVITKRIPAGAGLGGGSSDAAAVLRWAGVEDLGLAARIGADVAFCLVGGRARVTGIGERVEPLTHVPCTFTLLTPPIHCSTAEVYRRWDELGGPTDVGGNDLLPAALSVAPGMADARDALREASGIEPRLAGSGSTWFVEGSFAGPSMVVARAVGPR